MRVSRELANSRRVAAGTCSSRVSVAVHRSTVSRRVFNVQRAQIISCVPLDETTSNIAYIGADTNTVGGRWAQRSWHFACVSVCDRRA